MPCQFCGYYRSKESQFGITCFRCYRELLSSKHEAGKIIGLRHEVIDGQDVTVKVIAPAWARGCRSGLCTQPHLDHAKRTVSTKGKYRRK